MDASAVPAHAHLGQPAHERFAHGAAVPERRQHAPDHGHLPAPRVARPQLRLRQLLQRQRLTHAVEAEQERRLPRRVHVRPHPGVHRARPRRHAAPATLLRAFLQRQRNQTTDDAHSVPVSHQLAVENGHRLRRRRLHPQVERQGPRHRREVRCAGELQEPGTCPALEPQAGVPLYPPAPLRQALRAQHRRGQRAGDRRSRRRGRRREKGRRGSRRRVRLVGGRRRRGGG